MEPQQSPIIHNVAGIGKCVTCGATFVVVIQLQKVTHNINPMQFLFLLFYLAIYLCFKCLHTILSLQTQIENLKQPQTLKIIR